MTTSEDRIQFIREIADFLRARCGENHGKGADDRLIEVAARIAELKLRGRLYAAARSEGVSVRQIAKSYVAELFCGNGPESSLAAALAEHLAGSDIALFGAFEAAVVVTVSRQLFRHWRTNDPVSAKLWNNLHKVLKHDSRFHQFPIDDPEWVTIVDAEMLQEDATQWNDDELLRIACEIPSDGATLGDFIFGLLSEVASQPGKCQAVKN